MSSTVRLAAGWLLAIVAILAFSAAGRWQLARMHEKEAMLAAAGRALDRARPHPLLLASDPAQARGYAWSVGAGRIPNLTLWLDNQQRGGRAGVRMYCVLFPEDGVQAVLLDAGWWPLDGQRDLPAFGCPAGDAQRVRGMLAPPPSIGLAPGEAIAAAGEQRWLAARLDLAEVARVLHLPTGVAPRVLRLDPERAAGDAGVMLAPGERDLDVLANTLTPERHLGYAVQWFGLALTVLVIAVVLTARRRKEWTIR